MGFTINRRRSPRLTVDALIERQGKVLLIRRKKGPYKGSWALPGGFVEYGESVEEAVRREVKEETNLDLRIKRLLGVYSEPGRDPRGHVVSICFTAEAIGSEKGKSDASEARFFDLEEAKKKNLAFDHKKIIGDYECSVRNAKA